jgi:hypothetical protein
MGRTYSVEGGEEGKGGGGQDRGKEIERGMIVEQRGKEGK